jgi:hypothetical protein
LSDEIRIRLERSLAGDDDRHGTPELRAILASIAVVMHSTALTVCKEKKINPSKWLDDAWAFDRTVDAAVACLEALRPSGDAVPPSLGADKFSSLMEANRGNQVARWIVEELMENADSESATLRKRLGSRVMERLGHGPPDSFAYARRQLQIWAPKAAAMLAELERIEAEPQKKAGVQ